MDTSTRYTGRIFSVNLTVKENALGYDETCWYTGRFKFSVNKLGITAGAALRMSRT